MIRFLLIIALIISHLTTEAQKTVEFRISTVFSNVDDMDGFPNGNSDPQWDYEIEDRTFSISDNDNTELSGTNCPNTRTLNDQFFSQTYDCDLPSSWRFIWRGFEDDGIGSDANTGYQTINFTSASINPNQSSWTNAIAQQTATASGDRCGGGGTVTWRIQLQYRVTGSDLCKDECNDPYVLPTSAEFECQGTQTTTNVNLTINAREPADASESTNSTTGIGGSSCDVEGSRPEDVWIRTTIADSSGGVLLSFTNNGGCNGTFCETKIAYAWYTSSNGSCSGLEFRGCEETSCFFGCSSGQIKVDGIAGQPVWIRVWEAPGGTLGGNGDQGFSLTINTIQPTAPNDKCYTATPVSNFGCNYQATSGGSGPFSEPASNSNWTSAAHPAGSDCMDGDSNPSNSTVWASNENLVWYTFTQPSSGAFDIAVKNMTCTGGASNAQLAIFDMPNTGNICDFAGGAAGGAAGPNGVRGHGCAVGVGDVTLSVPFLPAGNYILLVDGNAGAQCEWEFESSVLLSLNLISFEANFDKTSEIVSLDWTVTIDDSQDKFIVQRSTDGVNFEDIRSYYSIYNAGVGSMEHTYSHQDASFPLVNTLYYRIKEIDVNGVLEYSPIVAVNITLEDMPSTVIQGVFPNPADQHIQIPFYLYQSSLVSAEIYTIQGQSIQTIMDQNQYEAGKHTTEVYVGDLPRGLYILRFVADGAVYTRKFTLK